MRTTARSEAPLDWYVWMAGLLGAGFLFIIAPDFVLNAVKGKVDLSLIGKGVQQRTEQVKALVTGTTPTQQEAAKLFGEVGNLGVGAWAIGNAEGTLNPDGQPTSIYEGHSDPANTATNRGFGSWQASPVVTAAEGDAKALERIKNQCIPHTFQSFQEYGLTLTTRLLIESCDIWIQSDAAAPDFAKNLKACQDEGQSGDDALLCARQRNYINPQTGQLQVARIFRAPGALEHDQRRRMDAIAQVLNQHKNQLPELAVPEQAKAPSPTPDLGMHPQTSDPGQSVVKILSGSEVSSGVVIAPNRIITVNHGLKRPDSIRIQTIDGKLLQGKLVKSDRSVDLALVEVNSSLPAAPLGEMIHPGDSVRSVGHPYGKRASKELQVIAAAETAGQITVTTGLAPGDSGGGLFNQAGQLVGVARAIDSRDGIGKVIPALTIQEWIYKN